MADYGANSSRISTQDGYSESAAWSLCCVSSADSALGGLGMCRIGDVYVGLTNDLDRRKGEHGNPPDWQTLGPFLSEKSARDWEKHYLAAPGFCGGPGGAGWKFGYWYTVTNSTVE